MREEVLNGFVEYLRNQGQRITTYNGNRNTVNRLLKWMETENINYLHAGYPDLLSYINHLTRSGNQKRTINMVLNSIRHFYNYLQQAGSVSANPAETLVIKNEAKRIPHGLLEWEELESLYHQFKDAGITGKRNKIILGLIIYQGLNSRELTALEITDVKLEEGKIYVPATARSNSRTMSLESHQILQIQKYITSIRPVILAVADKESDKLLVSTGKSRRMDNCYARLLKHHIKKINPKVKDYKQIRASVITAWLKKYNTRQVQYMAGHRYISSTEYYRTDTLENLQDMIDELHPLDDG
jgi:integrase/recombinase XerD